jgi:hypothetical protein
MTPSPIVRMLSSSKALVMLGTMAGAIVLVTLGKITWEQAERFLTITVPAWMLSVGLEDAAKHYGAAKGASTTESSTTVIAEPAQAKPEPPSPGC